ncbi:hypothetical protein KZZ52_36490 [Dactylosporangium sp. AC04546]|uniref:hypothetical protein n=1 Tax=Dactylosporangium sp. AC04546 TaxID=2862460 RepID=UPI001EDE51BA|nr:hypothetical protein [Dactylosporangium sp. AC04546]WVK79465.1 hypothetical protein KZZ52_36490 [Dactylosporangium sp. AC04546]
MRRLHAAVLALYPRAVRERYGEEIAALLEQSRTPVRDLTDVAWSALTDRAEQFVTADLPDALRRTPRWLRVASATVLACLAVPLLGFSAVPAAVVPAGLAAGLLCARRGGGFGAASVVIGAALALFTAPHLVQLLAGRVDRIAEVASTAAFVVAAAGLAALVVALVRRNRRTAALTAAVIGAFTLPQLATTMLVSMSGAGPTGNPWLAYWVSMLPYRGWSEASGTAFVPVLFDVLIWYPALHTLCLSFLLAFCFRATVAPGTPAPTPTGHPGGIAEG